ncbi:UDP-N-acetylglucosamine 1-carboxyvinyltransferase [Halobacteriovorax sp. GB3]|uniref:UDP-N-acetylglucosamine 1-carboxyvinyltransferase n=1 Tax=Halobacteriovorax sp. GB3 TaxID=2719615 RepID=UPI002362932A|nr:UDP-N-acetylglucosamine 1-carboxyvinyltransferase [Halobacteriovorax sp. GB3]MDD0854046.1 UDP-N-acetylglucosamine 1-carboxyvinyltransferase [Halobacteriovorax sp. GB3]
MDKLIIEGPVKLNGEVEISRAKNAYLPILAAVLLNDKPIHLKNLPELRDIKTMIKLLSNLGVEVTTNGNVTTFNAKNLNSHEATYDLVKTMRASIFTLGPLLTRLKKAKVSLPGGCAIGTRPIDLHLSNLEKLGAKINLEAGYVEATCEGGLEGNILALAFPSVGATENLMMAAVFANGKTIIENAAKEPEIDDLANFLNAMGAKITGIGTSSIIVEGVDELHEVEYEAIGDRIEAATYIMAGLMTQSELKVSKFNPHHLDFVIEILKDMGAKFEVGEDYVKTLPCELTAAKIDTAPFPGFPTDAQAQMIALMTQAKGVSIVAEHIFENRFMHVPELNRLGAKISLQGNTAVIEGGTPLKAAPVMCTDLRASAALVLAALCAEGKTTIDRVYHLERGYEKLAEKLSKLDVKIEKVNS